MPCYSQRPQKLKLRRLNVEKLDRHIKIENNKLTSFHTFVRNKKEVPLEVFSLCTNLNQNDLDKAPNLYEIKNDLLRFLGNKKIILKF